MEIKNRIFEKYIQYKFSIPLQERDRVIAKKGKIDIGDILFERVEGCIKKTLNLPKILHCTNEESERYVTRIDGEYVEEGEILAQKTSRGGLTVIEVVAPVTGMLDFSRIKQGYIDIVGEENKIKIESDFKGVVEGIDPIGGLAITADVVCIDGVVSSKVNDNVFGKLEILGDGNTILTEKALDVDYSGKIVWVGPYLYNRVAVELFERGALAILTYAMSYSEFRDIGLPIMIFGGFGSVHCDNGFLSRFKSFSGKWVVFNGNENQLLVISDSEKKSGGWFVKKYINQTVISRSTPTYGYIGKILEYDPDSDIVMVDFGKKGSSLTHIGLIDFIDL